MKITKNIIPLTLFITTLSFFINSINLNRKKYGLVEEEADLRVNESENETEENTNNSLITSNINETKNITEKISNEKKFQKNITSFDNSMNLDYKNNSHSSSITTDSKVDDFILNSSFQSLTLLQGLMSSSGMFISCNNDLKVTAEKTRFSNSEELLLSKITGEEDLYAIKSIAKNTYFTIESNASLNISNRKFFPFSSSKKDDDEDKNKSQFVLVCKDKLLSDKSKLKIKFFRGNYYIESKQGYIGFTSKSTTFTNFLSSDNFISGAFNFPDEIKPSTLIPKELCSDLECKKVNFKFKECDKYLTASNDASETITTLNVQSYKGGLINLSQGADFITISINKELVFLQTQTKFGLFTLNKVPSINDSLREIVIKGYGEKYLSCKNDKIYLSDSINNNTKIGY